MSERPQTVPGILYLVPTPIGHMQDITLRALQALRDAQFIAAEDTRHTRKLLTHFDIHPPQLFSCHRHNVSTALERIVSQLAQGARGALVTDAGTPGVSDPGAEVVARLLTAGLPFVVLPGPTAFVTALVGSGLDTGSFSFHGFLPRSEKERTRRLTELSRRRETLIFYESPHRIGGTMAAMADVLGDRRFVIGRELTKLHEEYVRGSLREEGMRLGRDGLRGELVVLVAGSGAQRESADAAASPSMVDQGGGPGLADAAQALPAGAALVALSAREHVDVLIGRGWSRNEAVREAAKLRGLSRNDMYRQLLAQVGEDK